MSDSIDLQIQTLLAEYVRVQEDIRHHKTTLQAIMNFIVIILVGLAALLPAISEQKQLSSIPLLMSVAVAFLAFYHSAYVIRIHQLAQYVDRNLSLKINGLLGADVIGRYDWTATPSILSLRRSRTDGRLTYAAVAGLKFLPQVSCLVAYTLGNPNMNLWRYVMIFALLILAILSSCGQND